MEKLKETLMKRTWRDLSRNTNDSHDTRKLKSVIENCNWKVSVYQVWLIITPFALFSKQITFSL